MQIHNQTILILSPHTDDAELGCGGTIRLLLEQGNRVHIAAFSACRHSVLAGFPEDVLVQEIKASTRQLGIPEENLHLFDYDVRTFNYHRQQLLDDILTLRENLKPSVVFVPSINDIHQDHYTIAQEAVRAFKFSTLLCYELPWNNFEFKTIIKNVFFLCPGQKTNKDMNIFLLRNAAGKNKDQIIMVIHSALST